MSKVDMKKAYAVLSTAERMTISVLHAQLQDIKTYPERFTSAGVDPVQLIEDIEFTLQGIWKFPRDVNYHTHWLEIKGCTCPPMDNADHWPTGRITVSDCPYHWKGNKA